jgi:hypothetical protein
MDQIREVTEDTRFNLKFNNLWAIVATTIMLVTTFGLLDKRITIIETKLDTMLVNQKELTNEVKDWRKQYEGRLGRVEIGVNENKISISNLQTLLSR